MTIKKAIGIGLLGTSIIGLIAIGIKFNFFNKQNIKTLQTHADDVVPQSKNWLLNEQLTEPTTTAEQVISFTSSAYFYQIPTEYSYRNYSFDAIKINTQSVAYKPHNVNTYQTIYSFGNNTWYKTTAKILKFTNYPTGNLATWLVNNATPLYENSAIIIENNLIRAKINNQEITNPYILTESKTLQLEIDFGLTALQINNQTYTSIQNIPNEIYINDNNIGILTEGTYSGTTTKIVNVIYNQGQYTITPTFTHLTSSNENYSIAPNGTWTTTLTAESGYSLPKTINVTGATANYNRQTGILTLSNPTGNVTLTATAVTGNVYETEVIDVRGLMLQILTMPFTFISQAFDLTLWPNTQYEFNIGNFIMAIISIASILFIIKLFTSGFSIIGNYTGSRTDTKLKKSQIEYNKARTDLARRTDPNTKTRINKKEK